MLGDYANAAFDSNLTTPRSQVDNSRPKPHALFHGSDKLELAGLLIKLLHENGHADHVKERSREFHHNLSLR